MTRTRRIGLVASVITVALGLGMLASGSAAAVAPAPGTLVPGQRATPSPGAPGSYTVMFDDSGASYWYIVCLKSETTIAKYPAGGGDRSCSEKKDAISFEEKFGLTVEYTEGDKVWVDFEMFTGTRGESKTEDNIEVTDAHNCSLGGLLHSGTFQCDWKPDVLESFAPPSIAAYKVDLGDPNEPVLKLLNLLAWLVSAAAVVGLLITGTQLALTLRHTGEASDMAQNLRPLSVIVAACLLATSAGPVVGFLGLGQ